MKYCMHEISYMQFNEGEAWDKIKNTRLGNIVKFLKSILRKLFKTFEGLSIEEMIEKVKASENKDISSVKFNMPASNFNFNIEVLKKGVYTEVGYINQFVSDIGSKSAEDIAKMLETYKGNALPSVDDFIKNLRSTLGLNFDTNTNNYVSSDVSFKDTNELVGYCESKYEIINKQKVEVEKIDNMLSNTIINADKYLNSSTALGANQQLKANITTELADRTNQVSRLINAYITVLEALVRDNIYYILYTYLHKVYNESAVVECKIIIS